MGKNGGRGRGRWHGERERERDGGIDGRLREAGMCPEVPLIPEEGGRARKAGAGCRMEEEQAQRNANGRAELDMQRKKYLRRAHRGKYCVKAEAGPPASPLAPSAFCLPGKARDDGMKRGGGQGRNKAPAVDRSSFSRRNARGRAHRCVASGAFRARIGKFIARLRAAVDGDVDRDNQTRDDNFVPTLPRIPHERRLSI